MTELNYDNLSSYKVTQLRSEAKRLGLSMPKSPQKSELIKVLREYKDSGTPTAKSEPKSQETSGGRVYSSTPQSVSKTPVIDDVPARKAFSATTTPPQKESSPIVSNFTFRKIADVGFFNIRSVVILLVVFILFGLYIINYHNDIGTYCILSGLLGLIALFLCNTHNVVDVKTR